MEKVDKLGMISKILLHKGDSTIVNERDASVHQLSICVVIHIAKRNCSKMNVGP